MAGGGAATSYLSACRPLESPHNGHGSGGCREQPVRQLPRHRRFESDQAHLNRVVDERLPSSSRVPSQATKTTQLSPCRRRECPTKRPESMSGNERAAAA